MGHGLVIVGLGMNKHYCQGQPRGTGIQEDLNDHEDA
jgi:hypothetical protein